MDRVAGVLLIAVFVFAFMFRWEIESSGSVTNAGVIYYKLDRWTGSSYVCDRFTCNETETR